MSFSARILLAVALFGTLLGSLVSTVPSRAGIVDELVGPMTPKERTLLQRLSQPVADALRNSTGASLTHQDMQIRSVRIRPNNLLLMDLAFRPTLPVSIAEMENLITEIESSVRLAIKESEIGQGGILIFFRGRMPEQLYSSIDCTLHWSNTGSSIALSASHGYYYNYDSNSWILQRPRRNGVTEDIISQSLISHLNEYIRDRSKKPTILLRSTSRSDHPRSGKPWWLMSSRYYVQSKLPNRNDIWGISSALHPNDPEREISDDITARPCYSNYKKAKMLISVHTNGQDLAPWRKGFKVYYHPDRPKDRKIAENIVCYMTEQRRSDDRYADFSVHSPQAATKYGEINFAKMPTVLVEVAYHTNRADAAALKDPAFQRLSMRAVEKGYRMSVLNKPCKEFTLDRVADSSGVFNTDIPRKVYFSGYPQFPVTATTRIISCASGWTCYGGVTQFDEERLSPLSLSFRCNASSSTPPASFVVETELTDADGITTAALQSNVSCSSGAGVSEMAAPQAAGFAGATSSPTVARR